MQYITPNVTHQPVYTWLWNGIITEDGIRTRIDDMYAGGIRAFYIISEPRNFRPTARATSLAPAYLSDAYLHLLAYAHAYAKEKGMHTWLYNEGGFPSGMAAGKVVEINPELHRKCVRRISLHLREGQIYRAKPNTVSAFDSETGMRIPEGYSSDIPHIIEEYRCEDTRRLGDTIIHSDIADIRTTRLFLKLTHDALDRALPGVMGNEVTYMFDDESQMGSWTPEFARVFRETYGYAIEDYMPYLFGGKPFDSDAAVRASIDYEMLCGALVTENYFREMRRWLHAHKMKSVGHLDLDHLSNGFVMKHYGNVMKMLRAFDVPGIDVIWSQITFPDENETCMQEGCRFYPRIAASAARQMGTDIALSESFAVYGAQVTPDEIRFAVGYQAIRGISVFNFMVMSYEKEDTLPLQYRPNFIPEYPGMTMLSEINDYTARLCAVLQSGRAHIDTALYYPIRTMNAYKGDPDAAKAAQAEFERLGDLLEDSGVSFDIINEEYVCTAVIRDGALCGAHTAYRHVFRVEGKYEDPSVIETLRAFDDTVVPNAESVPSCVRTRRIDRENGDTVYLFFCEYTAPVSFDACINDNRTPVSYSLDDGALYPCSATAQNGKTTVSLSLQRGTCAVIVFSDRAYDTQTPPTVGDSVALTDFSNKIAREIYLDGDGLHSHTPTADYVPCTLSPWDAAFSGEVRYRTVVSCDCPHGAVLDLGEVRYLARISVNGTPVAEKTFPPYRVTLPALKAGDTLDILVANTLSNACVNTDFFDTNSPAWVGSYHAAMVKKEAKMPGGGLLGDVKLCPIYTEIN